MRVSAVVLWFLTLGCIYLSVSLALRTIPSLASAVLKHESRRKHALDGLRGILALSVVIHHAMLPYSLHEYVTEEGLRAHPFVAQLGSASVALFFMISAYLFGQRLFVRNGKIDAIELFTGRLMRLCPLYIISVVIVVVIALASNSFHLFVTPSTLIKEICRQLMFNFVERYEVNNFPAQLLLGPVWSLQYEWVFYLCLPIMGLFYRITREKIAAYVPLIVLSILWDTKCCLFIAGLSVTYFVRFNSNQQKIVWQVLAVACCIILPITFSSSYGIVQSILLIPILVAVVQQHRWVSLIGSQTFRYLGEISFGIYLLHGVTGYLIILITHIDMQHVGAVEFVLITAFQGIVAVVVSTITFLSIEKPFMHRRLTLADMKLGLVSRFAR